MRFSWLVSIQTVTTVFFLLLSACSTIQGKATRDETYAEKLSTVRVNWSVDKEISTQTQGTAGRPSRLTYEQRADFARATATIQQLVREEGPALMSGALREKKVMVVPDSATAKTTLSIESLGGRAECTVLACAYQLALRANLIDVGSNKTVFSNVFLVGAPWPTTSDRDTVKSFVDTVVADMQRSSLFP